MAGVLKKGKVKLVSQAVPDNLASQYQMMISWTRSAGSVSRLEHRDLTL